MLLTEMIGEFIATIAADLRSDHRRGVAALTSREILADLAPATSIFAAQCCTVCRAKPK